MSDKKKKKEGKVSKLLLGVIVGGAVGSVLGATLSDKENRKQISKVSKRAFGRTRNFVQTHMVTKKQSPKKTGFWHALHNLFHGKK